MLTIHGHQHQYCTQVLSKALYVYSKVDCSFRPLLVLYVLLVADYHINKGSIMD